MKKCSIVFLQSVIVLIIFVALVLLIRFPLTEGRAKNLDLFSIYTDSFILYGYTCSTLFFVALFKTFRLLGNIKNNNLFSEDSIKILKVIRYCCIVMGILIAVGAIYINFSHNKNDDSAGFTALCIFCIFISITVATIVAVLEKSLQKAVELQSENDLTI